MPFDWRAYRDLAESLAQQGSEASRRSAISRAYYAAFNVAREFLEWEADEKIRDEGAHATVWRRPRKGGRSRKPVGMAGKGLQYDRENSDYTNPFDGDPLKTVEKALHVAGEIINEIDSFRQQILADLSG